jgi:hypothetical protein
MQWKEVEIVVMSRLFGLTGQEEMRSLLEMFIIHVL